MKIKFLLPILLAAMGCRASQNDQYATASPAPGAMASPESTYSTPPDTISAAPAAPTYTVEVISVQPSSNRITVRSAEVPSETVTRTAHKPAERYTMTVDSAQSESLRTIKRGDHVTITCEAMTTTTPTTGTGMTSGAGSRAPSGSAVGSTPGSTSGMAMTLSDCHRVTLITPSTGAVSGTTGTNPSGGGYR
jgi:hypothetical protein